MLAAKTISCFALYYLFFSFVNSLQALPFIFNFFILLFFFCTALVLNLTYANSWQLMPCVLILQAGIVLLFAFRVVSFCEMAGFCSFSATIGGKCGSSRGYTECIALNDCDGDISSHLANHHLSRENTCERDLILARAGLLELTEEQIKNMMVCPAHRFTLGKYWQAPKTCQYPRHHGKKSAVTGTHVINFKLAREIENLFGEAAPVGSRNFYR